MALKPMQRKKGFGKMDGHTPDGAAGTYGRNRTAKPRMDSGIEEGGHHTGGSRPFQGEVGREAMPAAPGGSRSLQGE